MAFARDPMKTFNYNALKKEYSDWIGRDSARGSASLEQEYYTLGSRDPGKIPQGLEYAATRLAFEGVDRASQGISSGWIGIRTAGLMRYWKHRMFILFYDRALNRRKQPTQPAYEVGLTYCHLLAVNDVRHSDWIAERLDESRFDGCVGGWNLDHPIPHLAIALHRYLANGGQTDLSDLELGVYTQIFDAWNEPQKLMSALHYAADYHVQNLDIPPYSDEDILEFTGAPYDIFPVEIHAIYRVRERLGLETPRIDHPLMNTPFGDPPKDIPEVEDPLLNRAIERVREVLPDL